MKNLVLIDQHLIIQYLSPTYPGTVHDKRMADAAPYPLPTNSVLLQDLGFLGFVLDQGTTRTPCKKPRHQELTAEQQAANRALASCRVAIEHVNSSIKRCRVAKEVLRLWRTGIRDQIIEVCGALHNFRLRLAPWLPMPQPE